LSANTVKVRASFLTDPVVDFIAQNPVESLWIQISKLHRDQSPLEANILFTGQIKTVRFKGNIGEVECVGFEWFLNQRIPKYRFQPHCNNTLYDGYCDVTKASYTHSVTVSGLSDDGLTLTSSGFDSQADGYFKNGYILYDDYYRSITYHVGDTITISYKIIPLTVSGSITAYAGCDLTAETCRDRFDNIDNFFGHIYIPLKNPTLRT